MAKRVGVQLVVEGGDQFFGTLQRVNQETSQFDRSMARVADQAQTLSERLGVQRRQYTLLSEELEEVKQRFGESSQQAQKKQLALDRLSVSINSNERKLNGLHNELEEGIRTSGRWGDVFTGVFERVGHKLVDFSAAGVAALGQFAVDSIAVAGDYEATLNRFASVTGSSLSDAGLSVASFSDLFLKMGADTQFSAGQAAEAAVNLAKGGMEPAEIAAGGLEAALNLAAAGELELAAAAEITVKQLGIWRETGVSAAEVTDLLAQAANASTVDVDDLALGLAQSGLSAKNAGLEYDELVQTMALIAPGFASASDAGTSLKTMLARLIPNTEKAKEEMIRLGLATEDGSSKFYDAQGAFIGMEAAAQLLQDATADLSEEERNMALQTIFGADSIRAAALLAEKGGEGFRTMGEAMDGAGTAAEQAERRNQGFNFALESLLGSLETLQIKLGEKVLPLLTSLINDGLIPIVNTVSGVVGGIDSMSGAWESLEPILAGIAATTGSLVAMWGLQLVPKLIGMAPIIAANTAAWVANAAAVFLAAAPYLAVAVAIGGVAYKIVELNNQLDHEATKILETHGWWNKSTEALETYGQQSEVTKSLLKDEADAVEDLRNKIHEETESLGLRAAAGAFLYEGQYEEELAAINAKTPLLEEATRKLEHETRALENQAIADENARWGLMNVVEGQRALVQSVTPSIEELEKLNEKLLEISEKGAEMLQSIAASAVEFMDGVETRRAEHEEKMTALLEEGNAEKIAAEEESYRKQEAIAAESYAEQQAAQRQHLGLMLIDYTNTQVAMGNITTEKGAEITGALAQEYGIRADHHAVLFADMVGDVRDYADGSQPSLDTMVQNLEETEEAAIQLKQKSEDLEGEYLMELVQNYDEGTIDVNEFRDAVQEVPDRVATRVELEGRGTAIAQAAALGADISAGVAAGITKSGYLVSRAVESVATKGIQAGRTRMQIDSPSRRTANEIGLPMAEGIAVGLDEGSAHVDSSIGELALNAIDVAITRLQAMASVGVEGAQALARGLERTRTLILRSIEGTTEEAVQTAAGTLRPGLERAGATGAAALAHGVESRRGVVNQQLASIAISAIDAAINQLQRLRGAGVDGIDAIIRGLQEAKSNAVAAMAQATSEVVDAASTMPDDLHGIGRDGANQMAAGIQDGESALSAAAAGAGHVIGENAGAAVAEQLRRRVADAFHEAEAALAGRLGDGGGGGGWGGFGGSVTIAGGITLPGFAQGGYAKGGMPFWAGEHGKELIMSPDDLYVLNHQQSMAYDQQRISPPSAPSQLANYQYNTTYQGPTLNYQPQYTTSAPSPAQDFAMMQILLGGG